MANPDGDAGPSTRPFGSASDNRPQTSCQALVSWVTGCGRDVGVELRIVETNSLQRDETPSSLRTLLVLRRLDS